jgi:hypothetical protein
MRAPEILYRDENYRERLRPASAEEAAASAASRASGHSGYFGLTTASAEIIPPDGVRYRTARLRRGTAEPVEVVYVESS